MIAVDLELRSRPRRGAGVGPDIEGPARAAVEKLAQAGARSAELRAERSRLRAWVRDAQAQEGRERMAGLVESRCEALEGVELTRAVRWPKWPSVDRTLRAIGHRAQHSAILRVGDLTDRERTAWVEELRRPR